MRELVLIGNAGNKRTQRLQEARQRLGLPPAYELTYSELLVGGGSLYNVLEQVRKRSGMLPTVRLDAPGEQVEVERALIEWGAPDAPDTLQADVSDEAWQAYTQAHVAMPISEGSARLLKDVKGVLHHPAQWFRGYTRLLAKLVQQAAMLDEEVIWHNHPLAIARMIDKRSTHELLSKHGVHIPRQLVIQAEDSRTVTDGLGYEALRLSMIEQRMHRVFVKLAYGSGACGVVAYQINPRTGAELAFTTLSATRFVNKPTIFYNTMRMHRYTDEETISHLLTWLLTQGAHIEQWVPKATIQDKGFDIRQLVINGEACHSIARASATPITNLHLRNERLPLDATGISLATQQQVGEEARLAASAFAGARIAGVDVMLRKSDLRPFILDVNPFGDLLYHVLHEGMDTYTLEQLRLGQVFAQQ